jgi:hypothetical protein
MGISSQKYYTRLAIKIASLPAKTIGIQRCLNNQPQAYIKARVIKTFIPYHYIPSKPTSLLESNPPVQSQTR